MESLVFVAFTPLALVLMGVVGSVAWRRREVPGGRALAAFCVTSAGWLAFDALSVAVPTADATLALARVAFAWCPLPGVAWLAFLLSYTGHLTRPARIAVGALTVWSLVYGGMALTTEAHRLVWATSRTVADGSLLGVAYSLGPLALAQTAFMWSVIGGSLGVMLWTYAGAGAGARTLSRWIVAGAFVPLVLSVVHLLGFGPIEKDFTPLAMAVSAGTFGLGLLRYRLLDLRPVARETLVDNLREGVLVLNRHGGIVDANPAFRQALGVPDALVGTPLAEVAPALAEAIAAGRDEPFRLDRDGDGRYFDLRISPLADAAGLSTGRLVLLHDVTRRRAEQTHLHRTNEALYLANAELQARNEELDAFAHTVAHDLKNSIHGVMGWAEVLRDEGPELEADEHREMASGVVRAGHKMASIVHELLLLAGVRQATVEPLPVAMQPVVEEALQRVRQTRDLAVAGPDRWPVALGHAPWIEEVWVNYLSNAGKYGGPSITLGTDVTASGQARFWVHDDGPGLTAEAQRALFVPFSRVGEQAVEGHGLGLSFVRRIAERLGGTCGVESAPGAGTRFWFALPLADAAGGDAAPAETALRLPMPV